LLNASPRGIGNRDLFVTARNRDNLREREFLAVKFEHCEKEKVKSKKEKVNARATIFLF